MSSKLTLKIFVEPNGKCPAKGKPGDAGLDAYADLSASGFALENVGQGGQVRIPLGFRYAFWVDGEVSSDYWLDVRNRSGVGTKSGMATIAEVGDASYRGILHYCAAKITGGLYTIEHGAKIAQLMITPFVDPYKVDIEVVDSIEALGPSVRGDSGFGSSGK